MWYLLTIPYSPQLNAVERVFSQVKSHVKRNYHANQIRLVEDIRAGCNSVTVQQTLAYEQAQHATVSHALRGYPLNSDHVKQLTHAELAEVEAILNRIRERAPMAAI